MSKNLSNLINYYRDCYRSDNRELLIYDFLDPKIENKICLDTQEEILNGNAPKIAIPSIRRSPFKRNTNYLQRFTFDHHQLVSGHVIHRLFNPSYS